MLIIASLKPFIPSGVLWNNRNKVIFPSLCSLPLEITSQESLASVEVVKSVQLVALPSSHLSLFLDSCPVFPSPCAFVPSSSQVEMVERRLCGSGPIPACVTQKLHNILSLLNVTCLMLCSVATTSIAHLFELLLQIFIPIKNFLGSLRV